MPRKTTRDGRTVYIPVGASDKFFYSLSSAKRYEKKLDRSRRVRTGTTPSGRLVDSYELRTELGHHTGGPYENTGVGKPRKKPWPSLGKEFDAIDFTPSGGSRDDTMGVDYYLTGSAAGGEEHLYIQLRPDGWEVRVQVEHPGEYEPLFLKGGIKSDTEALRIAKAGARYLPQVSERLFRLSKPGGRGSTPTTRRWRGTSRVGKPRKKPWPSLGKEFDAIDFTPRGRGHDPMGVDYYLTGSAAGGEEHLHIQLRPDGWEVRAQVDSPFFGTEGPAVGDVLFLKGGIKSDTEALRIAKAGARSLPQVSDRLSSPEWRSAWQADQGV